MSVDRRTRQLVLERDLHQCVRCGKYLGPLDDYSIHHRRPRGMGGSRDPETDQPANLLTLCGSGTTGCHGAVEAHRIIAGNDGYLLPQGTRPADRPVLTHRGWIRLDNQGGWREASGRLDTTPDKEPA